MTTKPFGLAVRTLIDDGQGRLLLLKRAKSSKSFPGTWEFPGGKVDAGEPLENAFHREVAEETGLTITLGGVAGATGFEMPKVYVIMLYMEASLKSGEVCLSAEHDDFQWVPRQKVAAMDLSGQMKSFVEGTMRSPRA